MNARDSGVQGERRAAEFLEKKGMQVLETNFRQRGGEIDIVAREGDRLVFVEVKARGDVRRGRPSEAVDARKQRRILLTAMRYMQLHGLSDSPVRFDVVEVLPWEIRHIPGAFDATDAL